MARSKVRTPKRNRKSKSMKKTWAMRKQAVEVEGKGANVSLKTTVSSVQKNPSTQHEINVPGTSTGISQTVIVSKFEESISKSSESIFDSAEELLQRNPQWCQNIYKGPGPSKPIIEREVVYGVIPSDKCESIENYVLDCDEEPPCRQTTIVGNRIVELGYVIDQILLINKKHNRSCTLGSLYTKDEIRKRTGLVSKIVLCCNVCNKSYSFDTENPNKNISDINLGNVWGTLATGSTYGHTSELLSCMNVPNMPQKQFQEYENYLGEIWKTSLWTSMENAGKKEREHALEIGNVCTDGIPWVTVYIDGSWSKRSYGTNYNALSGMVGIIGQYTGELLFISVRNKFCSLCARAENKNVDPQPHICYRNWNGSTTSMEADMAVLGFSVSEEMHGVRYCKFIADGDSSVFAKIKEKVPYGNLVKKIECTNHALKNYGKHLRQIKKDTSIKLEGRKLLTVSHIDKLVKRAKCSINEHSKMEPHNIQLLKEDLQNGLNHVFGDHSVCRQGICNIVGDQSNNKIPQLKSLYIYHHIKGALDLLARKAHLLIENENNNRAERLMNIVARFNMGKRLNLIQRGSYERRVYLSGLRYNNKLKWHSSSWKKATGNSPGKYFKQFMESRTAKHTANLANRQMTREHETKKIRQRKKSTLNIDYGKNVEEPEIDSEVVEQECQILINDLQVDEYKRNKIAESSIGQFGNEIYEYERQNRLTASLFGSVINRKEYTPCHGLVKSCLHPTSFHSDATSFGIAKEGVAIALFEKKTGLMVQKTGLWIDLSYGFLAASPDGLIGSDSIIEVKCLYSCSKFQMSTINEVLAKNKKTCLQIKDNQISLKRNHSYYYQVQGQLNICRKRKCYFVIYVNDQIELYIEEIFRDVDLWQQIMLPKLIQFYAGCIAPEIIRGNISKNKKCVDPPFILKAIKDRNTKREEAAKMKLTKQKIH